MAGNTRVCVCANTASQRGTHSLSLTACHTYNLQPNLVCPWHWQCLTVSVGPCSHTALLAPTIARTRPAPLTTTVLCCRVTPRVFIALSGIWSIFYWIANTSTAVFALALSGLCESPGLPTPNTHTLTTHLVSTRPDNTFFGAAIAYWSVKGWDLVDENLKLMNFNGGKCFVYLFFGLSTAGFGLYSSFFALAGAVLIIAGVVYGLLQFVGPLKKWVFACPCCPRERQPKLPNSRWHTGTDTRPPRCAHLVQR